MHSEPSFWTTLWTKLGFVRKRVRGGKRVSYRRRLRFEQCEDRRMLAPITVNSFLDDGDGGNITLREAIETANANPDHDTIRFAASLDGVPITLTQNELTITQSVTIEGKDPDGNPLGITIDANNLGADHLPFTGDGFTILSIVGVSGPVSGPEVEINSLKFTGSDTFGGNVIEAGYANLTLKNVTVTGNNGGAMIRTDVSNLTIENSSITDNSGLGIDFADSQYLGRELTVTGDQLKTN